LTGAARDTLLLWAVNNRQQFIEEFTTRSSGVDAAAALRECFLYHPPIAPRWTSTQQ